MTDETKQDMTLSEYWVPPSISGEPDIGQDWQHVGGNEVTYWIRFEDTDGAVFRKSVTSMVKEFTHKPVGTDLWIDLIWEEAQELFEAYDNYIQNGRTVEDGAKLLEEMADLQYVTHGLANELNWDLDEATVRKHKSNMSKLDDNGQPIYREDGKRIKGPNYKPPYLDDLVQ